MGDEPFLIRVGWTFESMYLHGFRLTYFAIVLDKLKKKEKICIMTVQDKKERGFEISLKHSSRLFTNNKL